VSTPSLVRAGGGLVWRHDGGTSRVLVVHRPRYDDWSFPKGKAEPDELDADTARRAVEEETGIRCVLDAPLGAIRYRDHRGRDKIVQYWSMRPLDDAGIDDQFVPNDEVDELRWCTAAQAEALLSYAHDRALLAGNVPDMPEVLAVDESP